MTETQHPQTYSELKSLYRQRRNAFRADPDAMTDLAAWKARDTDHDYKALHGLVPERMVGDPSTTTTVPFQKCDTWFSEFASHHPSSLILSTSPHSLIIGNRASYDRRQYPPWCDPEYEPGVNTPEGQGFGHCLVISRPRVYNIVDPDAVAADCALIKEMRAHFIAFWDSAGGPVRLLRRTRAGFDAQVSKLETRAREHGDAAASLTPYLRTTLLPRWDTDFRTLSHGFGSVQAPRDFEMGFHAFPDMSVGHLHMHVFPRAEGLREYSTKVHDWKTVPIEAVLEVEREDAGIFVGRGERERGGVVD